MAEIYTEFFGFKERPFTLLPDPEFLFWSQAHTRAFSVLEYGVMTRAPITVITGEVGAGKTTLVRKLISAVDSDVTVGLVSHAVAREAALIPWVMSALNIRPEPGASSVQLFDAFQAYVVDQYAHGKRVVLIFDEAQGLSQANLEELRMLTNINSDKDELLQLILVGQPELRNIISKPELRQFAQRVTANFHLRAMDRTTTADYIRHRLTVAGGTGHEFTEEAAHRVHDVTQGVPRLVNQVADFCLVYAMADNEKLVLTSTVDQVLQDQVFFSGGHVDCEKRNAD